MAPVHMIGDLKGDAEDGERSTCRLRPSVGVGVGGAVELEVPLSLLAVCIFCGDDSTVLPLSPFIVM